MDRQMASQHLSTCWLQWQMLTKYSIIYLINKAFIGLLNRPQTIIDYEKNSMGLQEIQRPGEAVILSQCPWGNYIA